MNNKEKTRIVDYRKLLENGKIVPLGIRAELEGITPLGYTEMISTPPQSIEYVIFPWLPVKARGYIFAATGVGKTLFTMNLAYAIAMGGNYLRYSCPMPRKVLYIDGEMSWQEIHNRFLQVVNHQGKLDMLAENWNILTPDKVFPLSLPKICSAEGQIFYNGLIEKHGIEVLILDNLATLAEIDESKPREWLAVQNWLISLSARGITTILVHHAGKNEREYRGTSRMLDTMQAAILLENVNKDDLEGENIGVKRFKVSYRKARNFGGKDALPFEVHIENNSWTCQSLENSEIDRVIEKHQAGMKQRDIAQEMGCSQSKVFKLLQKARKLGLLRDSLG